MSDSIEHGVPERGDTPTAPGQSLEWTMVDPHADVFDRLTANDEARRAAEVAEYSLIAEACDTWTVDDTRADAACEKLIAGGADGTSPVGEFLALELAGLLRISPARAAMKIRDTLNLRDRHPELWSAMITRNLEPWKALNVTTACADAGLSAQAARWVDHQLALVLDGLPWGRIMKSLDGLITRADPALAAEHARRAHEARYVQIGNHAHGSTEVFAKLDTEHALDLDTTLNRIADHLTTCGNTDHLAQRRATALGMLAHPAAVTDWLAGKTDTPPAPHLQTTLIVHIAADTIHDATSSDGTSDTLITGMDTPAAGDPGAEARGNAAGQTNTTHPTPGVVRIEHVGPLDTDTLQRFLADSTVTVRPIVDLNTVPPVDAYEIPDRLRHVVCSRNPIDVFPFGTRHAAGCDLDHTIAYNPDAPPGARQTRHDNLGPLNRRAHRAKTARRWKVDQIDPGVFIWTSPTGHQYEVNPDRTIPLGRKRPRPAA